MTLRRAAPAARAGSSTTSHAAAASRRSTTRRSSRRPTRCSRCSAAAARGTTPTPETDYELVDAIEVNTGPPKLGEAPNPFTRTAIDFYEEALAGGARAAALGVSDSHNGRADHSATQSPVGVGATAVFAKQLSERGLKCAVKAGHTYAKIGGPSGPTLRFTGRVPGARKRAIFGDSARGRNLKLAARATGGGVLQLLRDGR